MLTRGRRVLGGLTAALALAVAAPAGATSSPPAPACTEHAEPGLARAESDQYVVVFRTRPPRIAVGEHFALDAAVCPRAGAPGPTGLRVDAHMPAHRHGMNYRAEVSRRDGAYVAEGLLFHMPGHWQLVFDVEIGRRSERLVTDVVLDE